MASDDINLDDPTERFRPDERDDDRDPNDAIPADVTDAIEELKLVLEAEGDQRDLEEDDLEFDAGEQWPDDVKQSRRAQTIDNVEIPARPMLTIPKIDQPVQLVINQQRRAHLGISVHAESEDAERHTAEILAGIMRHIQNKSNAEVARNWAFERATKAGRGYYRILARYCDHAGVGSHWSDQELVIKRILNQSSVYLDPYAQEPDFSDGTFAQIGGWVPARTHKQRWPDSLMSTSVLSGDAFDAAEANIAPNWMSDSMNGKGLKGVRVMERFKVTTASRHRIAYASEDGSKMVEEFIDAKLDAKARAEYIKGLGDRVRAMRETSERKVTWQKLNALEILEEEEWGGKFIPIIPVIGREQFFKNTRRWVGMIRPAKDGQRLFNYAATAAVEKEALDTKAPYIGYEGQFKGHEAAWAQSATRNFPYLQAAPVTIGGQPAPLPQRNVAGPNLDGSLALLQAADNFIKSTTFTFDASLGNTGNSSDSGRKVLALQQQGDQGNSHYLDNLATLSMPYESKVLLDLIPAYYDRPGRVQQIIGTDDEPTEVMLNAPFVKNKDGHPQRVEQTDPSLQPKKTKHYDLRKGSYTAVCSIGKNYESRLREGSDEIGKVLEAAPEMLKIIGDIYFKFRDFPGHQEIADRMKKMLPPELQDDPDADDDPEALKAKLGQMQQALNELKQAYEEATKALETKQVEAQGKLQSEQVKAQSAEKLAAMKLEGDRMLAEIDANLKVRIAEIQAQIDNDAALQLKQVDVDAEREAREDEQRHEIAMLQVEHAMDLEEQELAHEQALVSMDTEQDHEVGRAGFESQLETERAEADHEHASTEAERERAHASSEAEAADTRAAEAGDDGA